MQQSCDVPITKQADSPTVTAGGLAGFRITAHNRGHRTARNLLLCDRIPRKTRFVTASRRLRRVGAKRCLLIRSLGPGQRAGFHLTLRVNGNAKPGTLDNTADETPVSPPGVPAKGPAGLRAIAAGIPFAPESNGRVFGASLFSHSA
jgi:uncharacterized repeat protein (TIGR01451 family)